MAIVSHTGKFQNVIIGMIEKQGFALIAEKKLISSFGRLRSSLALDKLQTQTESYKSGDKSSKSQLQLTIKNNSREEISRNNVDISITVKDTNDQADEALEFSKESWFRMHHEIAAATVFRELLGSKLTERQISYELARRGYTYTETA